MASADLSLSQVIQSYMGPHTANRWDAFVGSCLAVFTLAEMLGPVLGWPTITGRLYGAFGYETQAPGLATMLLLLIVQLGVEGLAGQRLWRTSWPGWVALKARGLTTTSIPDPNKRETSLGLLTGFVFTPLLLALLGYLPSPRAPLIESEVIVFLVSITAITLALIFPPTTHYDVAHPDDVVFERITRAPFPVQLRLSQTEFQKSILLRKMPDCYEACRLDSPIRADAYEHVLINYGVLEKKLFEVQKDVGEKRKRDANGKDVAPVQGFSANAFKCEGRLSFDVHPLTSGEIARFDTQGVEKLINSFYERQDFFHFFQQQLTKAIHEYAGKADAKVKTATENFRLSALTTELATGKNFGAPPPSLSAALSLSAAHITQLEVLKKRIEERRVELAIFRKDWEEARSLQEQGVRKIPNAFEEQVLASFADQFPQGSQTTATIKRLLLWANVKFHPSKFEFTETANEAETFVTNQANEMSAKLGVVEQKIEDATTAHAKEIRDLLRGTAERIDPRMLMNPQGHKLFVEITRLLLLDDRALVQQGTAVLVANADTIPAQSGKVIEPPVITPNSNSQSGAGMPEWLRGRPDSPLSWNRPATPPVSGAEAVGAAGKADNPPQYDVGAAGKEPF